MLIEEVRHGNAPMASWWRHEGEVAFLDFIDGKNKDKASAWLHDYPEEQCIPSMSPSETRMIDVLGAIQTDQIDNSEATEVIQAITDANIARKKVASKRRMQLTKLLIIFPVQASKTLSSSRQTGRRKRF